MLHRGDAWAMPVSLLWGGLVVRTPWTTISTDSDGEGFGFSLLAFIPFVAVALYLTVGRFFFHAYRRAHTLYALTTERVIILTGRQFHRVDSVPLTRLAKLSLDEARDSRGSITLHRAPLSGIWRLASRRGNWAPPSWPGTSRGPAQLQAIADAQSVFQRIRAAQPRAA